MHSAYTAAIPHQAFGRTGSVHDTVERRRNLAYERSMAAQGYPNDYHRVRHAPQYAMPNLMNAPNPFAGHHHIVHQYPNYPQPVHHPPPPSEKPTPHPDEALLQRNVELETRNAELEVRSECCWREN